jgi:outer membrane protein assembly factor BamB
MNLSLRTALAAAAFLACASSQAATLIGLNSQGQLARIDTANIAGAMNTDITGLMAGDRLVGIDTRPKDGKIYGVSLANQLYTVDEMTGAANWVAALSAPVIQANLGYGIDFNPVADFGTGASLRLVSSAGDNFAINAATGVVGNAANKIAAGYTAVGYTNTTLMPAAAPASTALYYIDSNTDMLAMAPAAFNTPTITMVGALGVDVLKANGFEVLGNGQAYAALNVDAGPSLATGIYSINLGTGAATLLGTYNGTLSGLTVSAVPEPGTYAMMALGLLGVGLVARRRRA